MIDIEKDRLNVLIKDMSEEDIAYLVTLIPSDVMQEELASRDRLKTSQLSAISLILSAKG